MSRLSQFLVSPQSSIRDVIHYLNINRKGIALVVDDERKLAGTITDGDIRRAMLEWQSLDVPASELLAQKDNPLYAHPVTAPVGTGDAELLRLMQEHDVRQVPLLDGEGHVCGLVTMDDLLPDQNLPLQAVIMAGGAGTRLRPLTDEMPKPMLPLGDRPLMALIIEQLRQAGIRKVNITTHYQPEKITGYFGDGEEFGVELCYVPEDRPLGTAGALGLMARSEDPFLVINGDILTQINFRAMLAYHREHGADLTVGVRKYDLKVPYGVVECEGHHVCRLREKPSLSFFVNAGIYLLEPLVHRYILNGEHLDMTDLIERLIAKDRAVVSFPIVEYWLDIGEHGDSVRAQEDIKEGRITI